ncbi:ubiquitin domain-containing DSK2a-like isoform X1 [Olea europaea subsp. europaea]|uniref:Ubiquitin domain-containing DSK2a-like isoform X1 n=1 Tax=Olea europaea subsp. europaea TaxID=158383 RepID=A0A8S0VBL0_OLEEU|nr:ubiquitin domain-containing DSK2a-like isoform X1 [Olea europaea subsp. europaea]
MGSSGAEDMKISGNDTAGCSETTVEIKIKTLDSQTYTLRVDKCVPVPQLKEKIASVTGVLSEQQRLICRGKVLKDDQLLSAYHVEDGHTLHLVVRQPVIPSSDGFDLSATDPISSTGNNSGNQVGPGVVVGTFNISEQGDGAFPDLNRIVSTVLNSFGIARMGSGSEGIDLNQPPSERTNKETTTRINNSGTTTSEASHGQGFSAQIQSGLGELLRTIFPAEHIFGDIVSSPPDGAAQDARTSQEAAETASREGILLSNILHQIMPVIQENSAVASNGGSNSYEPQDDENRDQGAAARQRRGPQSQPSTKRPRRE